ncbi:glycerophosphodiester phosphodiesterase [Domibacillus sp. A3M-37]|uniref:glycerophosphodiester phosphodiesterase n=1 Tax=Domibacillus sp. A3M-37 TaxID=2962037 RepID=UPI0020B6B587|nr:glycerophosphodiester phosphodiesterase [Domibacillus sp. A3M-37]MCP3764341.1 glycerophosphodiester phosphodiesterase [Domibacillus sp. A3M-37]
MKTSIYGHRGCKGTLPENTLLGFKRAIELGVDGLEIDIHMTKDGELVVIHDETLDRTTNAEGFIYEASLEEINKYSTGIRFSGLQEYEEAWNFERVPTLQNVLDLIAPYDLELNIELKTYAVPYEGIEERVLETVKKYGGGRKIVYSSFHLPTLIRLKERDGSAQTAWLLNEPVSRPDDYMKTFGFESLHLSKDAFFSNETYFHEWAGQLRIWTVNDPGEITKLVKAGVEAVITDFPERALTIRDEQTAAV